MSIPQVAIVGRPNVGKSSLFNWLAGRRISIVDPTPGVTRDRIVTPITVGDRYIEIVDTGGMGIHDKDNLTEEVERQISHAIDRAAVILFLVDARSGIVPLDEVVVDRLRGARKPILLVANKTDTDKQLPSAAEFYRFGFGDVIHVSAMQNRGKPELLTRILRALPMHVDEPRDAEPSLKIAIVGRRNTGKSTFINGLAQEERTIVSEIEGTTRDSVDVHFQRDGRTIIAIDTAGARYRTGIKTDVDFYSLARAERSIRRADVVLHFFDAAEKTSLVDKQLAGYVLEQFKPCIFVVNKWDLAKDRHVTEEYGDYMRKTFPSLDFVPIAFITAKTGKNTQMLLDLAQSLYNQAAARVSTGELNRVLRMAIDAQAPSLRMNRQGRVYYATQVATLPPTVVLFTNGPELFDKTYQRYLLKTFRDHLPFHDIAIKMYLRDKDRGDAEGENSGKPPRARPKRLGSKRPKSKKKGTGDLWQDV